MGFLLVFSFIIFFDVSGHAEISADSRIPTSLKCLWSSYRTFKITADKRDIIFPSGAQLPFQNRDPHGTPIDRSRLKSIDQMFLSAYPRGVKFPIPQKKDELRGSRFSPLFLRLYGNSPQIVEADLVWVKWVDGSWVAFNKSFGAAQALQRVVQKLRTLVKNHPEYKRFLRRPIGGTYNWRHVSHEPGLSMHAFGAAIDINISYSNYWRWELGSDGVPHYRNRIPPEIAEVFEENGFIWGGKWYHYDTMHFEYRPELLMSANECERRFAEYRD